MFFRSFGDWFFLLSSLQGHEHYYTASLYCVSLRILAPGSVGTRWHFVECGGPHSLDKNILYHVLHCALVILATFREYTVLVH